MSTDMRFTDLADWLSWQESLHSSEIDMGLSRVRAVAERMDLLSFTGQIVSVAGTNGKGSCVATLEALCVSQGITVGAFTSPHLFVYNERIRLNGDMVSDSVISASFQRIDDARGDISLTYFEFGTLAAIDIFFRQGVQVMLLEVGLGGRLDAVNVMDADVSVVTSIAIDHEEWLGSDRAIIGREKSGIFRAHKPAICADLDPPETVAEVAQKVDAQFYQAGDAFSWRRESDHWVWQGEGEDVILPFPNLPEPSVAAALVAYQKLGYALPTDLPRVIQKLRLPGRTQSCVYQGKPIILDVAHNPAAAGHLSDYLASNPVDGRTFVVVAMMADKDIEGVFQPLIKQVDRWWLSSLEGNSRAASAAHLGEVLTALGEDSDSCSSVEESLMAALNMASPKDRIVVFGSFFTVSDAQTVLDKVESVT